jgi:hypothetical protein
MTVHDLKGGRPPSSLRTVLRHDLRGRPVETAPFARRVRSDSSTRSSRALDLSSHKLVLARYAVEGYLRRRRNRREAQP